jgi:hypothetical protein
MSKLRLLKVVVQPVFVIDDGEHLTEQPAEPKAIASSEWAAYVADGGIFDQSVAALAAQVEGPPPDDDPEG